MNTAQIGLCFYDSVVQQSRTSLRLSQRWTVTHLRIYVHLTNALLLKQLLFRFIIRLLILKGAIVIYVLYSDVYSNKNVYAQKKKKQHCMLSCTFMPSSTFQTVDSKLLHYASFPKMERMKPYPVDMTLPILFPLDKTTCAHMLSMQCSVYALGPTYNY